MSGQLATSETILCSAAGVIAADSAGLSSVKSYSALLTSIAGAPLASPTFTGTPVAPTASEGTNTTQIATTAFVATAAAAKVSGPASATDNAIVRFDGTTGKLVQDTSGVTISDAGQIIAAQGTITTSQPFTISQTWNAGGVSFVGMLIDVTNSASATGSSLLNMKLGGVSAARFGKPGTNGSIGVTDSAGLTLKSGVDTLYLSGDNGYRCSIVSTYGLAIYTGECMSVGGPANGVTPGIMDHNGLNISRRGIVYARHSGQVSSGPTVMTTCYIKFGDQVNDDPVIPFVVTGNACDASGTTNIVGGAVSVFAGAGASGSAGNAHGGTLYLSGGQGYGTGSHGPTVVAHTGSAARGPVLVGKTSNDSVGMLQVEGAITASAGIAAGPVTFSVLNALTATATLGVYRITDRSHRLARPDGTNWRFLDDDAIIS